MMSPDWNPRGRGFFQRVETLDLAWLKQERGGQQMELHPGWE